VYPTIKIQELKQIRNALFPTLSIIIPRKGLVAAEMMKGTPNK
jgi:hypothetical protein